MTCDHQTTIASQCIRVLLVDDHERIRQALKTLLVAYDNLEVIGEAENGEDAITMANVLQPAVIVMDINMPKMDGIEATARIKSQIPSVSIIGISVTGGIHECTMIKAGATAFLTKASAVESLYETIMKAVKSDNQCT